MGVDQLVKEYGIPTYPIPRERYRGQKVDPQHLIDIMIMLDEIMGHDVVMIGGVVVYPQLAGYHRLLRFPSNDIDAITTDSGLRSLLDHSELGHKVYLTEDFGDLFIEIDGIPCGFDVDETHGWIIPASLWDTARTVYFGNQQITHIAPEFLSALKWRRAVFKGRVYGKDKCDIGSLMLASAYEEKPPYDHQLHIELALKHASPDKNTLLHLTEAVRGAKHQLRAYEQEVLDQEVDTLASYLN